METRRRSSTLKLFAAYLAISAAGLGVRFVLAQTPGPRAPGMCEVETTFWRGDQMKCSLLGGD